MTKPRKNITIDEEHEQFLEQHDGVNLSGVVRDTLDDLMEAYDFEPDLDDEDDDDGDGLRPDSI